MIIRAMVKNLKMAKKVMRKSLMQLMIIKIQVLQKLDFVIKRNTMVVLQIQDLISEKMITKKTIDKTIGKLVYSFFI